MSRLPPLTYDQTDDRQRALWDRIVESRGGRGLDMTNETGSLMGPFQAMVQRPHAGEPMTELGGAIRFGSSLDPRLLEIAICTVGAHWKSEFEFWAHRRLGLAAGVEPEILDALAAGTPPPIDDEAGRAVHAFAAELLEAGRVGDATWQHASDALGVDSVLDLVLTIGYYCQISLLLNACEVVLPAGQAPTWG